MFRAAAGRYYNEGALPTARDAQLGFVQLTIPQPGYQGDLINFDPFGPNPNRIGVVSPNVSVTRAAQASLGYTDQFSAGVQAQIGHDLGLAADVVRALGYHLPVEWDQNYPVSRVRPDPTYLQIIAIETIGQSWYTGLQLGLRKRPSHHYAYAVAYTWSLSENNADGRNAFAVIRRTSWATAAPRQTTRVIG